MTLPPIPAPIEDYALLSDRRGAALVSRAGSIDWLCWPRFDSAACLAALLGSDQHGRWQIRPDDPVTSIDRHYRDRSMVLETRFRTGTGAVTVIDCMALGTDACTLVRLVRGDAGTVALSMTLRLRFDYGCIVPWVTRLDEKTGNAVVAIAGPDLLVLRTDATLEGEDMETVSRFTVRQGETVRFTLAHGPSHLPAPDAIDPDQAVDRTDTAWRDWAARNTRDGDYADAVARSLLVLKSLSYAPTGGIVAAPTTSLPESLGGKRNWDYRYCWLRDATMTLAALMDCGYYEEAQEWGHWLHRSVAGSAEQVQIMYGIAGERRLDEWTVPFLPGYEGSLPVRIGNQAAGQVQLDVYGEVMASMRQLRLAGLTLPPAAWSLQVNLLEHLAKIWREPDEGIWEVRGGRRQFTFSKVMAWLAFNCAVKDAEEYGLDGPVETWRTIRDEIHRTVCESGFHTGRNSFVQSFNSDRLDASLLLMPLVGFLPVTDQRMAATIAAIEANLMVDGLLLRYSADKTVDGQDDREGAFLACTFWLVNCRVLLGRDAEARTLFEFLLGLRNDVGLLAEEYDTKARRQVGNFPQALSHMALATSAAILHDGGHRALDQPRTI
jgi:GH15 family glucan-1,4-alpha-glucosidase